MCPIPWATKAGGLASVMAGKRGLSCRWGKEQSLAGRKTA